MKLTFLGSGDAFGHGGRLQPCILVNAPGCAFLMDCGATAMTSLHRYGVQPNAVEAIFVTHLHGDHFGGLPFFILDAQLHSKRTTPLLIAGPWGTGRRLQAAMETMFPGSSSVQRKFTVDVRELDPGKAFPFKTVTVLPFEVNHASGDPALAFRVACAGRIVGYTGDTEWTENVAAVADGVDLLVAEAYFFEKRVKYHLDYTTLMSRLGTVRPKRVILTHMSEDMLSRRADIETESAEDGMVVDIE